MAAATQDLILRLVGEAASMEKAIQVAVKRIDALEKRLVAAGNKATAASAKIDKKATASVNRLGSSVARATGKLRMFGAQIAALAGIGGVAMLAKKVIDLEGALAEVSTIAGVGAEGMRRYRDTVLEVAEASSKDVIDLTRGLYQTISSGITDQAEATKILHAANKLAIGGLTSMKDSVNVLTLFMNAYRGSTLTATEISDQLFKAVQLGRTTMEELAANLGAVATIAAQAGVSTKELLAAEVELTKAGLDTAEATTALRATILAYLKPAKESADAAKKLGIELSAARLKEIGLVGAMEELNRATNGQIGLLTTLIPNIRAIKGVAVLASDEGIKVLNDTLSEFADVTGVSAAAAAKMEVTVGERFKQLGNVITTTMAKALSGEAIGGLGDMLESLIDWIKENQDGIIRWGKVLLDAATMALKPLGLVVESVAKIFEWFGKSEFAVKAFETAVKLAISPLLVVVEIGEKIYNAIVPSAEEGAREWRKLKKEVEETTEKWKEAHKVLVDLGFASKEQTKDAVEAGRLIKVRIADGMEEYKLTKDLVTARGEYTYALEEAISREKEIIADKEKEIALMHKWLDEEERSDAQIVKIRKRREELLKFIEGRRERIANIEKEARSAITENLAATKERAAAKKIIAEETEKEVRLLNLLASAQATINELMKESVEAWKATRNELDYILASFAAESPLAVAVKDFAEEGRDAFDEFVYGSGVAAGEASGKFETFFVNPTMKKIAVFGGKVGETLKAGLQKALGWVVGILENVWGKFMGLVSMAGELSPEEFGEKLEEVLGNAEAFIENLAANLPTLLQKLADWIPTFVQLVADNAPLIVDAIAQNFAPLVKAVVDAIPQLIKIVVDNIGPLVQAFVSGLLDAVPALITEAVTFLINFGLLRIIYELVAGFLRGIRDFFANLFRGRRRRREEEELAETGEITMAHRGGIIGASAPAVSFNTSGLVTAARVMRYAIGGFVSGLDRTARRLREVPALLRPGEGVLTPRGVGAIGGAPGLAAANAGMGGGGVTINAQGSIFMARHLRALIDELVGSALRARVGNVSAAVRGGKTFNRRGLGYAV